jgi:hypothetical protein
MAEEVARVDKLLGAIVNDLVKAHGGVRAVARKVPISPSTISRWKAGRVGLSQLGTLANALDVTVHVVIPPAGKPTVGTEKSPPAWAEGLVRMTVAEMLEGSAMDAVVERALEHAEAQRKAQSQDPDEGQESDGPPDADEANAQAGDQ